MVVLYAEGQSFYDHDPGPGHPESSRRLVALRRGVELAGVEAELSFFSPRPASNDELMLVHSPEHLESVRSMSASGGGLIDPDTAVSAFSYEAARRGCGAGIEAIERLRRREATAAFLAVRPPGHHAGRERARGFCLFNSAAVATAALVGSGERVLIVDLDAHHGNGTQEIFYTSSEVLYVSLHAFPFYPGTGALRETGEGGGKGATINLPLGPGTAGDAYRLAVDEVLVPAAETFAPSWLVVSLGFDAHRDDPLTDLGLSAGDYFDLVARVSRLAAPGRRLAFLEGGYDTGALAHAGGAALAALCGATYRPEPATSGGVDPGFRRVVAAARARHEELFRPDTERGAMTS